MIPQGHSLLKLGALVTLSVQNAVYTLCRRYAFGVRKEQWSSSSVLFAGELIKLVWAGAVIIARDSRGDAYDGRKGLSRVAFLVENSKLMMVPAVIFWAMNLLSYVALKRIDAATFTVLAQGKIASTAVCSVTMLGRTLSANQIRALALLAIGQVLMNSEAFEHSVSGEAGDSAQLGEYVIGAAACILEVILSGACSVYFEKILKKHKGRDIWDRNVQLAVHSLWLYAPLVAMGGGFQGWTVMALVVAVLGALGGILVAISVKITSSIHKTFATAGAIVQTCFFGWLLLGGPMSVATICGAGCALLAIFIYTDPTSQPPASPGETTSGGRTEMEESDTTRHSPTADTVAEKAFPLLAGKALR